MPSSILFVHQGFELYGSDRTLIQSVQAAVDRWPDAHITVLLPSDGPLRSAMAEVIEDVRVVDLGILRKADVGKAMLGGVWRFIRKVRTARRMMKSYDLVYINTVIVVDYLLASCLTSTPRLVHVHEIPTGLASVAFSFLLTVSRAFVVFNSQATRRSFSIPPWQRFTIVWNGAAISRRSSPRVTRAGLNILLIGRFNSWKGQSVLLEAVALLPAEARSRVRVRLVGGFFGKQAHFADQLISRIADLELSGIVDILPFVSDPSEHYAWADIVAVPSIKPEPFGLVAIEGMAAACCVIASDHGGLSEIVLDGITGTLLEPGSARSLSLALQRYVQDPSLARAHGDAGQARFSAEFDQARYKSKIVDVVAALAPPHVTAQPAT